MFAEKKEMVLDETEKMLQELLIELLRTDESTLTPPDVSENILESAKEDENEKLVQEFMETLRTRRDSGGSTLTPPDVSENISESVESAKEDKKEKLVQKLVEKLGERRNLRDSGGRPSTSSPHDDNVLSDMLGMILKFAKEEDKPDPYIVDWTLLKALLIKFRELKEKKEAFFRLPCKISHGEDDPHMSKSTFYIPVFYNVETTTSQHQQKWKQNPVSSNKYRKGACENCGAMTHDLNSCMEGSLNHGSKSTYIPSVLPDTKMAKRSPKHGPKSTDKCFEERFEGRFEER